MKELIFPRYLYYTQEHILTVIGYLDDATKYTKNRGYVDRETGKIYVYDPMVEGIPYFTVSDDGTINKFEWSKRQFEHIFDVSKTYEDSLETIVKTTPKDRDLYNEEALADMNAATSVFVPELEEGEDPLKRIIKMAIIEKGVDINRLKCRFPQKYGLTNLKSALVGKTKMSIKVFLIWCHILELDFEFTLIDNGNDYINPLRKPIVYSSRDSKTPEIPGDIPTVVM